MSMAFAVSCGRIVPARSISAATRVSSVVQPYSGSPITEGNVAKALIERDALAQMCGDDAMTVRQIGT